MTKDELLDAVWPQTAVTEAVVRVTIGLLRKVLGDTAQTPQFIATVARRGYRFLAPVNVVYPPETVHAEAPQQPAVPTPRSPEAVLPTPRPVLHWGSHVRACAGARTSRLHSHGPGRRSARARDPGRRAQADHGALADLKDSMALIHDLDPEAAQQLLDPALHAMMDAVHRYEGTVNQVLGDGIMALFGAPIAHEDHAVRACYAALAMQAAPATMPNSAPRPWPDHAESHRPQPGGRCAPFTMTCIWITRRWDRRRTWRRAWSSWRPQTPLCSPPRRCGWWKG